MVSDPNGQKPTIFGSFSQTKKLFSSCNTKLYAGTGEAVPVMEYHVQTPLKTVAYSCIEHFPENSI